MATQPRSRVFPELFWSGRVFCSNSKSGFKIRKGGGGTSYLTTASCEHGLGLSNFVFFDGVPLGLRHL